MYNSEYTSHSPKIPPKFTKQRPANYTLFFDRRARKYDVAGSNIQHQQETSKKSWWWQVTKTKPGEYLLVSHSQQTHSLQCVRCWKLAICKWTNIRWDEPFTNFRRRRGADSATVWPVIRINEKYKYVFTHMHTHTLAYGRVIDYFACAVASSFVLVILFWVRVTNQ